MIIKTSSHCHGRKTHQMTKRLNPKMRPKLNYLFIFLLLLQLQQSLSQPLPSTIGHTCEPNQTINPCQTYAFYRATAPDFLDLASIADLFSVSRLMISKPSNISSPSSPLIPNQSLFIPLTCSCNTLNSSLSLFAAKQVYTFKKDNTFFLVSTGIFGNLTTYQAVEVFNPTLVPTLVDIGEDVVFPVFCKCPNQTQLQNQVKFLVSYVFQSLDNVSSVASLFGVKTQSIIDLNGNNIQPLDTIFIPVTQLPELTQPAEFSQFTPPAADAPYAVSGEDDRKIEVIGLAIGLGVSGLLLILVIGIWVYREKLFKKREVASDEEKQKLQFNNGGKGLKNADVNLMADVSDCLDKYRVFKIEQLIEATDNFSEDCLIQGSVYKGSIADEIYAIKKMKWNAYEELKILQMVNHGNLVKLEGFCIDPEDANCYLVYEYIENGSLHSWLHGNKRQLLNWKTRLRIGIDIANGLQYIHEHTRPRVVHKDIKSSNILLDSSMRAKIANFGLAKSGCNAITMHIVGTQGYIAPEYLADGVVSTKMDVFSFGVILLELLSGKEAVDEDGKALWGKVGGILEGNNAEGKMRNMRGFMDNLLLTESCSMEAVMSVMAVAIACFHRDPSQRPTMVDLVYTLSKSEDFFNDISDDGFSEPNQVVAR